MLCDRFGAVVDAVGFRIVRQLPDAEEVVMERLAQAWRESPGFATARRPARPAGHRGIPVLLSPFPLFLFLALPLSAQGADLARERAEYATWLATAPLSPYAAVAVQPIGPGLTLGPADVDIPLAGFARGAVHEFRGSAWLERDGKRLALPRERPVTVGAYRLLVSGPADRSVLAVYGPVRGAKPPAWYPPAAALSFSVTLEPPERREPFRTLGPDGIETDAREAGFVTLSLAGGPARLRVYQVGPPDDMDSELLLYFRDATNGKGSYPAGRFVPLEPQSGNRYRLDLNRARNPFCAYSSIYPCPPPWPGNTLAVPVAAGEKYAGSGE